MAKTRPDTFPIQGYYHLAGEEIRFIFEFCRESADQ